MTPDNNFQDDDAFLLEVEDIIQSNLSNPYFGVGQLADMIHMHRSSLTRKFVKLTGESPQEWIVRKRMQNAKELLTGTDIPVNQIAMEVGYEELSNFSRAFKSFFGISPSNVRKNGGLDNTCIQDAT